MTFVNAYEKWTLYDTVVIASNANELWNGQGYFTDYNALGIPSTIPFFNVRNKSAGEQYCNFDSANKLPYVFHCYSMGIDFESPICGGRVSGVSPVNSARESNIFFSGEIVKHAGFILKVSQDEKLVQTGTLLPSGQGIGGWQTGFDSNSPDNNAALNTIATGNAENDNVWDFAVPIAMPREVNIEGQLILSSYARDALAQMQGPGDYWTEYGVSGSAFPAACQIRVTMYGKREVQQRNELHYN